MGSSPSSGAVTIDWGGLTQTGKGYAIEEYAGVDTSGTNGSGALVQSVTVGPTTTATSVSVTLAALGAADHATAVAFWRSIQEVAAPRTGWTETVDLGFATPATQGEVQYKITGEATSSASGVSSSNWAGIAVEIKIGAAGGEAVRTKPHLVRGKIVIRGKVRFR